MPSHVAITGASGFLGNALSRVLAADGVRVTPLVRRTPRPGEVRWDPAAPADLTPLGAVDAVIHLAGANIAGGRWTRRRTHDIRESRRNGTTSLVASLLRLSTPPPTLLSASAIGIYGDRGDEVLTERSETGTGFLAEVGREWEGATEPAARAGMRVATLRTGIVLATEGGALPRMALPFRYGVGGRLGGGRQWVSWILLDDWIAACRHALATTALRGPLNLVAPLPSTNSEFTAELARALRRPAIAPVPAWLLRLALGRLADEALLASQRAVPEQLLRSGFRFRAPALRDALAELFPGRGAVLY